MGKQSLEKLPGMAITPERGHSQINLNPIQEEDEVR
jgi:hypothetical protein